MQVTCLSCRARYAVGPLAIGPTGRTADMFVLKAMLAAGVFAFRNEIAMQLPPQWRTALNIHA